MKKTKIIKSILIICTQYTLPPLRCMQSLKKPAQIGAEKCVTEIFIREKGKWTNKGNDK